ncbi:MAG: SCO family protein [Nannocystaceae bacterium]
MMRARPLDQPPHPSEGSWLRRTFIRRPWHVSAIFGVVVITLIRPFQSCYVEYRNLEKMQTALAELPILYTLPDFALIDENGKPFTRESMAGRVWVTSFFFTSCPSICPRITRTMMDLQGRLGEVKDHNVGLVSFTVDPENDTPEVLKRHGATIEADPERWRFVTGPKPDMEKLVVGGFKFAMDPKTREGDTSMYDIAHATKLVVVDQEGNIRGLFNTDEEGLGEALEASVVLDRAGKY